MTLLENYMHRGKVVSIMYREIGLAVSLPRALNNMKVPSGDRTKIPF